jgi:AcrR family transcriptional regulator
MRERQRAAVRNALSEAALELTMEQGFDVTTVDQIVETVGVSRRTFFHYFPTKEDAVLGDVDALGERLRTALEARPRDESAWTALGEALRSLQGDMSAKTRLALADLYERTPSLQARHLQKHLSWQRKLAPDIEKRIGVPPGDPRAVAVIAAALACLDVAVEEWRQSRGKADIEAIFLACVAAVRDA